MFHAEECALPIVAVTAVVVLMVASCRQGAVESDPQAARLRLPDAAGAWRAADAARHWDPETIFGYIDGHAEVYLAYGMRGCDSRRYSGPAGEPDIVLDVFELASVDDAFGVYTLDQDGESLPIGQGALYRYGWLSFWKGAYFVSVTAEDETEASTAAVLELGRAVEAAIAPGAGPPAIVESLPAEGLVPRTTRFLRSHQILNTYLYLGGDDLFGLDPEAAAVLARYQRSSGGGHLLVVSYPTAERARSAAAAFAAAYLGGDDQPGPSETDDGLWFGLGLHGKRLAAVLAADSRQIVSELLNSEQGDEG